jgi:hypothetical protein
MKDSTVILEPRGKAMDPSQKAYGKVILDRARENTLNNRANRFIVRFAEWAGWLRAIDENLVKAYLNSSQNYGS